MDYLVFRLYGPMVAWGDIAIGEVRADTTVPSKSAIMGLLGAALGLERGQEEQHQGLNNGYELATQTVQFGSLLRDYHTTQIPDSAGKVRYATRRDEIVRGRDRLNTQLSARDYRCDALAVVALKAHADAPYSLSELSAALRKPHFTPYLGRKACPLAAPMAPTVVSADDYYNALTSYDMPALAYNADKLMKPTQEDVLFTWEGGFNDFDQTGTHPRDQMQTHRHMDALHSRYRWQFKPEGRQVNYLWAQAHPNKSKEAAHVSL